jgi:hypothetical protein
MAFWEPVQRRPQLGKNIALETGVDCGEQPSPPQNFDAAVYVSRRVKQKLGGRKAFRARAWNHERTIIKRRWRGLVPYLISKYVVWSPEGRIIIRPGRSDKGPMPIPGRDAALSATDPPPSLQVHRQETLLPPPSLQQPLHPKGTRGLISVPT